MNRNSRKAFMLMILAGISLLTASCSGGGAGGVEEEKFPLSNKIIPDEGLRYCVNRLSELSDWSSTADVRHVDCSDERLNPPRTFIKSISGISVFANLESLNLTPNSKIDALPLDPLISDLSPLHGMSAIRKLSLNRNSVSDLIVLSTLKNLEYLDLTGNNPVDFEPLKGLKKLRELRVRYSIWGGDGWPNANESVSGLSQLSSLTYGNAQDEDFSPIRKLTGLKSLSLYASTGVSNIDFLGSLPALEELFLRGFREEDVSFETIGGLRDLRKLTLINTFFFSASPYEVCNIPNALSGLVKLESLALEHVNGLCVDLSITSGMVNLKSLSVSGGYIRNFSAVGGHVNLEVLAVGSQQMDGNRVAALDLQSIYQLQKLKAVWFDGVTIFEYPLLSKLPQIEYAYFDDVTAATDYANGCELIPGCGAESLPLTDWQAVLSGAMSVEYLSFEGSSFNRLDVLYGLPNLKWLNIRSLKRFQDMKSLTCDEIRAYTSSLPVGKVEVYSSC
ncbi:hypothetical protein HPT27_05865 [Permianibacter sp. IMCC34836]|uniref:leucine-rich repeat domain-containing protein n=1 Tax=Permianibacter fluminis TaxID=2738515 RepID=UPI00155512F7|nr:leucine-rich repeat domain-containing protein [Permianibacter fluminis]NQD36543.1 hypothetical protein [Permianibacter fluminis]